MLLSSHTNSMLFYVNTAKTVKLGLALVPALKAAVAGLAFDMVRKLMVERAP